MQVNIITYSTCEAFVNQRCTLDVHDSRAAPAGPSLSSEDGEGDHEEANWRQETRQDGHVRASVWMSYARSAGWASTTVIAISLLLMQVILSFLVKQLLATRCG